MKTFRTEIKIALSLGLLVAFPRAAFAIGEQTGRIVGRVVEQQTGAPVPGATITTTSDILIGGPRQTTTDEEGRYEFPNLPPGTYDVEVSYSGVKPIHRRILVRAGEAAPLEIEWSAELAQAETTVVVEERHLTRPDTPTTGATFSMEKQNMLAVPRQYQSVVTQAPGVIENGTGNPQVKGGNIRNNRVLIDGLDTTDPVTNTFSANVDQDSLAAIQVITGAMEAKYNAIGSIQNLITTSGSDDLHFDISFYTRLKQLQTFHGSQSQYIYEGFKLYDPTPQPPSKTYQGNFHISGPIIKHQLWYAAGVELDWSSTVQPSGLPIGVQAPNRVFQDAYPRLKLTWAPTTQHKFMIEGIGDPTYIDYENNATSTANTTEPLASTGRFQGGWKSIAEWDYFISQNVDTKVLAGYSYNSLDVGPQGKVRSIDQKYIDQFHPAGTTYDFGRSRHQNQTDNTFWDNDTVEQVTKRHRVQLDGSVAWRGRWFGTHDAELGLQSSFTFHDFSNTFTGGGSVYVDNSAPANIALNQPGALCDQDPFIQPDPSLRTGAGCFARIDRNDVVTKQRGYTLGAYIQDRWKPYGWLTVIPGVRLDWARASVVGGLPPDLKRSITIADRVVQTDDYIMNVAVNPRLSAIVDLTRDQKTIFQASYGRASENIYLTALNQVDAGRKSQLTTLIWNGLPPPNGAFVVSPGGAPTDVLADSSGRTPPHADEVTFSLRRELFRNTLGEIDYTYKRISNILETVETNLIYDPAGTRVVGFNDPSHPNSILVYSFDPRNYNNFSGFDFIFESRPTPNFDFFGVYTLSWTYGPGFGEIVAGDQFGNPRQSQLYTGFSPATDTRHIIKTQGTFTWHGLISGLVVNWRSGIAQRKSFTLADQSLPARYRSPTGTDPGGPLPGAPTQPDRNSIQNWAEFRTPDLFTVNLLVGYDFYELTKQHLILNAGIENLFDSFATTTLVLAESAPPSRFGLSAARQAPPFRLQLGLRYQY